MSAGLKFKRRRGALIFIELSSLIILFAIALSFFITPIMKAAAEAEAERFASALMYDTAVSLPDELFTGLCEIKPGEGIALDTARVNKIRSLYASRLLKNFSASGRAAFYVPLGNLTGSVLLSGRGPSVKLYTALVGAVETDIVSEFTEAGINQTRHTVYITTRLKVRALFPFSSAKTAEIKIPVAEAVTVGDVPAFFAEGS